MSTPAECSVCASRFVPRFAFQVQRTEDQVLHFCSQRCHEEHLFAAQQKSCSVCATRFDLQFAYQQTQVDGELRYYCSTACRQGELTEVKARQQRIRRIAVLNQKGGTGKTTTSVNVSAALAQRGHRVLLMDLDAQGNVAVSLGLNAQRSMYDVIVDGVHPADCIVNVAENLDALISNTSLAQAEVRLVNARDRTRVLANRMGAITNYDFIVMDCGPSLSVLNQNALTFADDILIPVSCDYLSLVGVKQILRTLKKVNEHLLHPVNILGVVPTFFDVRTRISVEAVNTLKAYFKDRVTPPIRVNTRLREAPSHKKTIFEYAPDSSGARDYLRLVDRLLEVAALTEDQSAPPASDALAAAPDDVGEEEALG